ITARIDRACIQLYRRYRHVGLAVEVDQVAHLVDRETRLHVVDDEAELRMRRVLSVPEGGETEPHQLVVQAPQVVLAEIADVVLGLPSGDRAAAAVDRVARGADEQPVAGVAGVAAGALGRAGRSRRLAAAARW